MNKGMIAAGVSCVVLLSLVSTAFGQIATDFTAPVPETGSMLWMLGAATAGLASLRLYLGKKR